MLQEGLFLLWLLTLVVSILSWGYLKILYVQEEKLMNRQQITGCELARQILDRHHLHRTSVHSVLEKGREHLGPSLNQFLLAEKGYYGTRLVDLAEVLHEVAHYLEALKSTLPVGLRAARGRFARIGVIASWILILGGFLLPSWGWMSRLGQIFLVSAFFLALASLLTEWEVTERAIANLSSLEGLGTDERMRMKRLLKAIRWGPLAELLRAPFSKIFAYDLSKSKRVYRIAS